MPKINPQFYNLKRDYIFSKIQEKTAGLTGLINLGIGDISKPLSPLTVDALCQASHEMGQRPIGYGPSVGYTFLKQALHKKYYQNFSFNEEALFISDGINSDCCSLLELFDSNIRVGIPTLAYPAYRDAAIIAGKKEIVALPCLEENDFSPNPPNAPLDIIYLCSPCNPTGTAMSRDALTAWVRYAERHGAIILFDAAYAAFITDPSIPRSIYEIEGAERVAIEMGSFSKSHGFTGLRCSWSVVPMEPLRSMWDRRQNCKFNGVAYPIQHAAAQSLTLPLSEVAHYMSQAKILREGLEASGYQIFGGHHAPYIWWKTPDNLSSWDFFDLLLKEAKIISIPGAGFGPEGEGFMRLSTFTDSALDAIDNIKRLDCAFSCRK